MPCKKLFDSRLKVRFQLVSCGVTAHQSNPCKCGDYAAVLGGEWTGSFQHFDREFKAFSEIFMLFLASQTQERGRIKAQKASNGLK